MNNLSERVQREFNEWKEKYEVPYHMEFHVKALLKLQEEYDNIEASSNTTKTRETLLHMIQDLYKNMLLKEKKIKCDRVMYIDYLYNAESHLRKVILYLNNKTYCLNGERYKTMSDYADVIKSIAEKENTIIYIDAKTYGKSLYDILCNYENLTVKELEYIKI